MHRVEEATIEALRLPAAHRAFLLESLPRLMSDDRVLGVMAAGSVLTGATDEFSDLDLVVAVETEADGAVMRDRLAIVERLGPLLTAFTGEHVGEPRIIISLYGPPLLHVDFNFVPVNMLAKRGDEPLVLCERGSRVSDALPRGRASTPKPDPQWIEDRIWVWVHYVATKIARGEIFEALDGIANIRRLVLGPLALGLRGAAPYGVRRIEIHAPEYVEAFKGTVAGYEVRECLRALRAVADCYVLLRQKSASPGLVQRDEACQAALDYLAALDRRLFPEGST
jgi:predicted nucleotidyltransferase